MPVWDSFADCGLGEDSAGIDNFGGETAGGGGGGGDACGAGAVTCDNVIF